MLDIRRNIIRTAHAQPHMRAYLLQVLKEAGAVVPLRPDYQTRNPHTVRIRGGLYYRSDFFPMLDSVMDDLAGGEETEGGAQLIDMARTEKSRFRYLWLLDTERNILVMWSIREGNEKTYDHTPSPTVVRALDKKMQLNRVNTRTFKEIEAFMDRRAQATMRALKKTVKNLETDYQRQANGLVEEFFNEEFRPKLDQAMRIANGDTSILGFTPNMGIIEHYDLKRQRRSFLYEKIMSGFTVQTAEKYAVDHGFDLDAGDNQAVYWAVNDIIMGAAGHYIAGKHPFTFKERR